MQYIRRACKYVENQQIQHGNTQYEDVSLYNDIRERHTILFGSEQGSIRLLLERNADQMGLVAHYIHLCFQTRMSDESHLAPHPGL